jgi:fatty acid desaturase
MFNDIHQYRPYHLLHHKHAGEEADPDLQIVRGYPTTPIGMIRKSLRDFLGYTGLKTYIGLTMIHLGFLSYSMGGKVERLKPTAKEVLVRAVKHLGGPLLVNAILFGICWLTGHPWVYLVWVGAMFSTSLFSFRVRAMAEHGVIELNERNDYPTRSTLANPLERLLFAPHNVNYHVEHHLLMTVPSYNLPKFHQLLKSKGFYQHAYLSPGYWDVILTVAGVRPPLRPEQPLAAA